MSNFDTMTEKDIKVWKRMVDKRKEAWKSLPRSELVEVITPVWTNEMSPPVIEDPWERTEWLLMKHFRQAVDRTLSPDTRRASWESITFLLQQLDGKYL